MTIYVQSKSGDHNATLHAVSSLADAMRNIRSRGFYFDDKKRCVPFEEIQFIKEEKE